MGRDGGKPKGNYLYFVLFFLLIVQCSFLLGIPGLDLGVSGSGRFPGVIILLKDPIRSRIDNDGLGGGSGRCGIVIVC